MAMGMRFTATCYKTFLVGCNVILLFTGVAVLILGVKMKDALSLLLLVNIPIVMKMVKAVIAAGFFMTLTALTGIFGACYEMLWLLIAHFVLLVAIAIFEFSLGVTLVAVKKAIHTSLESSECNSLCVATLDAAVLDYALPSVGLMVAITFVEAGMMYSTSRLYYYIRDGAKTSAIDNQIVQMEPVSPAPPAYVAPPAYAHVPPSQSMYAAAYHPMYFSQENSYTTSVNSRR